MSLYLQAYTPAFDELYRRHAGKLFAYLKRTVPAPIAEELLQDVFARMHAARATYKSEYPFLPWLFTISRHALFDYGKKAETRLQKAVSEVDPQSLGETPPSPAMDIDQLLTTLSPQHQRIFKLRYLNDWSFDQISRETELSAQNVRQIISRGIKKLQSLGVTS